MSGGEFEFTFAPVCEYVPIILNAFAIATICHFELAPVYIAPSFDYSTHTARALASPALTHVCCPF